MAAPQPIAIGNRIVAPPSGKMPRVVSCWPDCVAFAATHMSAASVNSRPAV
jgi:hypothetical protein